jgi:amino acid adenylation domain-containing protein
MSDLNMSIHILGNSLIPQSIGEQARVRPDAAALVAASTTLTYAELDRRANQLAHYLQGLGVGPEKLVALCIDRSPDMVVAALAVLKAGGAYLPLDPAAPADRLDQTLRDAEPVVLVTTSSLRKANQAVAGMNGRLAMHGFAVVNLEKDAAAIALCSTEAPAVSATAENLAYVIYTSGSTGQPKGVEVTHGNLRNLLQWHLRAFEITAEDRASHQASLGFDAAVWEVWPYLAAGASVHFPEDGIRSNPGALRDWLVEQGITIAFLATPLAESMMLLDWPREVDLRILLTGADTLHRRPSALLPFTLVNNYGPTECTVVATSGVVAPAEASTRPPSIGKPIDNTRILILDEQQKPVAAGQAGELYIGGASVARGYRNRAELTAQRFVAIPSGGSGAAVQEERFYRTGDLVRQLSNGELEFLGRIDEQIKIRGYRIEPSEIVSALDASPDVDASAVMAVEDGPGDKRLVAYVALVEGAKVTAASLRDLLGQRLPDYMIPATFVRIESLPITSNGKVDWPALPRPHQDNLLADEDYLAPRNIVEEKLAAIIAPLLHVERVSVHDNFFFRGGHSLLGTQLLTRIGETFGVDLSLLSLFEHPTLAEMSEEIERLIFNKIEAAKIEAAKIEAAKIEAAKLEAAKLAASHNREFVPAGMRGEDVA